MTSSGPATSMPSLQPRTLPLDLDPSEVEHPRPFLCDVRITPDQMSRAVDHVSNIEFIRWLDRAAELHADHLGHTRARLLERGIMWFVARHEIDYRAEAHAGDTLIVATWVRDMTRVKSWRDSIIIRPADRRIVCRAATLWVLVDLKTRRPIRVPVEMATALDPLDTIGSAARKAAGPCTSP